MQASTKLNFFVNDEMPRTIRNMMEVFFDRDTDPEVSWHLFRQELRKLKKRHKELYLDCGEEDDHTVYESAISKHRREKLEQK